MSEEQIVKQTDSGNFSRVYMTPDESSDVDHTPEGAVREGRVRTEEENFREQHKVEVSEEPQEQETLFAGKYKSAEELEKAYKELESKLGQAEPSQPEQQQEQPTEKEIEKAMESVTDEMFVKGMNEFNQTGQLSQETIKQFTDKGIPEGYINQYLDGIRAQVELNVMKINEKLGGEQHVKDILAWAEDNLSDTEIESYNTLIDSGDLDKIITAYQSIEARMSNSSQKKFISPAKGSSDGAGFQSKAEMIQAMSDPRYQKDPAFRKQVEARLARSRF